MTTSSTLPTEAMVEAGRLALMNEREHDRCISLEPEEMRVALTASLAAAPRDEVAEYWKKDAAEWRRSQYHIIDKVLEALHFPSFVKNNGRHISELVADVVKERDDYQDEIAKLKKERDAVLAAAARDDAVALWMIKRGYATGHGDTTEDLLGELETQAFDGGLEEAARYIRARKRGAK